MVVYEIIYIKNDGDHVTQVFGSYNDLLYEVYRIKQNGGTIYRIECNGEEVHFA